MFPLIPYYIRNKYIDAVTKQPVAVNEKLKETLNKKAKKVLALHRRGISLIFPNVLAIEQRLLTYLAETVEVAIAAEEVIEVEVLEIEVPKKE